MDATLNRDKTSALKFSALRLKTPFSSALMTQLSKTTSSQTTMTSAPLKSTAGKSFGDLELPTWKEKHRFMFTTAERTIKRSSAPMAFHSSDLSMLTMMDPIIKHSGKLLCLPAAEPHLTKANLTLFALKSPSSAQTLIHGLRPTSTNTLKTKTS